MTHFAALLTAGLLGCGISDPSYEPPIDPGPEVRTDRLSYTWPDDRRAEVTVHNPLATQVYYHIASHHLLLEFHRYGRWNPMRWFNTDVLEGDGFAAIPSGGLARFFVPLTNDVAPTSGWYRVRVVVLRDRSLSNPWPGAYQVSPPFWLGPPER